MTPRIDFLNNWELRCNENVKFINKMRSILLVTFLTLILLFILSFFIPFFKDSILPFIPRIDNDISIMDSQISSDKITSYGASLGISSFLFALFSGIIFLTRLKSIFEELVISIKFHIKQYKTINHENRGKGRKEKMEQWEKNVSYFIEENLNIKKNYFLFNVFPKRR